MGTDIEKELETFTTTLEQDTDGIRVDANYPRIDKPIIEWFQDDGHVEILGQKIDGSFESFKAFAKYLKELQDLKEENELYKHRLEVANEFIESRQEAMIPEHYDDLKYILNECDLESTW